MRALRGPVAGTLVMTAVIVAARHVLALGEAAGLVLLVPVGTAIYVAALALLEPADVTELRAIAAGWRRPGPAARSLQAAKPTG